MYIPVYKMFEQLIDLEYGIFPQIHKCKILTVNGKSKNKITKICIFVN